MPRNRLKVMVSFRCYDILLRCHCNPDLYLSTDPKKILSSHLNKDDGDSNENGKKQRTKQKKKTT